MVLVGLALLALSGSVLAQTRDCRDPKTQSDMTACAVQDFDAADKAMNAQWKITRKVFVEQDATLEDDLKGAEKALLKAQRAWIDYRDGQCEAQGFYVRGGTMEPMEVAACKAEMTKTRTKELKSLAEPQ
ncbi:lysozyme inhibitor LprI family protein [Agrobacterium vitis]